MNPAARSTKAASLETVIRELSPEPEVHRHRKPPAMRRDRRDDWRPRVMNSSSSAGGDGTMNEVLQGLCRANARRKPGEKHTALGCSAARDDECVLRRAEAARPGYGRPAGGRSRRGNRQEIDLWMANEHVLSRSSAAWGLDAQIVQDTSWEQKEEIRPAQLCDERCECADADRPPTLSVQIDGKSPLLGTVVLDRQRQALRRALSTVSQCLKHRWSARFDHLPRPRRHGISSNYCAVCCSTATSECEYLDYIQTSEFTVTSDHGEVPVELDGELADLSAPVVFRPAPFSSCA
jgi:diacylglycerol kinase (ATP)